MSASAPSTPDPSNNNNRSLAIFTNTPYTSKDLISAIENAPLSWDLEVNKSQKVFKQTVEDMVTVTSGPRLLRKKLINDYRQTEGATEGTQKGETPLTKKKAALALHSLYASQNKDNPANEESLLLFWEQEAPDLFQAIKDSQPTPLTKDQKKVIGSDEFLKQLPESKIFEAILSKYPDLESILKQDAASQAEKIESAVDNLANNQIEEILSKQKNFLNDMGKPFNLPVRFKPGPKDPVVEHNTAIMAVGHLYRNRGFRHPITQLPVNDFEIAFDVLVAMKLNAVKVVNTMIAALDQRNFAHFATMLDAYYDMRLASIQEEIASIMEEEKKGRLTSAQAQKQLAEVETLVSLKENIDELKEFFACVQKDDATSKLELASLKTRLTHFRNEKCVEGRNYLFQFIRSIKAVTVGPWENLLAKLAKSKDPAYYASYIKYAQRELEKAENTVTPALLLPLVQNRELLDLTIVELIPQRIVANFMQPGMIESRKAKQLTYSSSSSTSNSNSNG